MGWRQDSAARWAIGLIAFLPFAAPAELLVTTNSTWRFRPGTNEVSSPTSLWRTNTYSDSAWTLSAAPFYYGPAGALPTNGTRLGAMSNNYGCIFIRQSFVVSNPQNFTSATLRVAYDDGFFAWLNGRQIARKNMAATEPTYTTFANTNVNSTVYQDFALTNSQGAFVSGSNVLCIQAFNRTRTSSDFYMAAELNGFRDATAPVVSSATPVAGSQMTGLTNVTVRFSENVLGVNASDFLLNGRAATSMTGSGSQYVFTVTSPSDGTGLVSWVSAHGIADLGSNAFNRTGAGATWSYVIESTNPVVASVAPPGDSVIGSLTNITVGFSEPVSGVDASDLLLNGSPALSVSGSQTQFVFAVNQPAGPAVAVTWAAAHGIADAFGKPFDDAAPGASWSYTLDPQPPAVASASPPPGSTVSGLATIAVSFTEPVQGVDAGDLLVNYQPALAVTGSGSQYVFTVAAPAPGTAGVTWEESHGIIDFASPPNNFDPASPGSSWSYTVVDGTPPTVSSLHPPAGTTVRALSQVEVAFSEPVSGVDAADLLVNGQPSSAVAGGLAGPYVFQFAPPATGDVSFAWAGGHGIADLAASPNAFTGASWIVRLDPSQPAPQVRINEVLASNQSTNGLADEDGDLSDWIELFNAGAQAVDLEGWSLTDDADEPAKWIFPAVTLAPGEYRVVFASGKDRKPTTAGAKLHANFQLNPDGEYVGLWNADSPRQAVSEFAPSYPEQRNDISWGPDLALRMSYFAVPTPGAPNTGTVLTGLVPQVHFNVGRGYFRDPFDLLLSVPMDGAAIRYTTNGEPPTASGGFAYTGAIRVARTTIVRATAFRDGHLPSRPETRTYLFPADVVAQPANPAGWPANWGTYGGSTVPADYAMDPEITANPAYAPSMEAALLQIPALSIATHPDSLWAANGIYWSGNPINEGVAWERAVSCEWIQADGDSQFQIDAGIRIQGGAGRIPSNSPKHSFRLLFKGDYGAGDLDFPLFPGNPVESFDTVILRAGYNNSWYHWDTAQRQRAEYMRDQWVRTSQEDMGHVTSAGRYVHVYLNGLYWGLYNLSERPDANFAAAHFGGERENWDALNSAEPADGDLAAWNTLQSLANAGLASNAQYEAIQSYVDVVNLADYMILNHYAGNDDWDHHNWYAVRPRGSNVGFRFVSWDSERTLESPTYTAAFNDNNANMPSRVYQKLRDNAEFRLLFADRLQRHCYNGGALAPDTAIARFSSLIQQLNLPILAESARWGDYRRDVQPRNPPAYLFDRDGFWTPECNRILTQFLSTRRDFVVAHYTTNNLYPRVQAPVLSPSGGPVAMGTPLSMSSPSNAIYYTTNGLDPRVYGTGAIAPAAIAYGGPFPLDRTVTIRARAWSNNVWSALVEARFLVNELGSPLRISEIMYNPPGGDAYEFIEVRNTAADPVDAGLVRFDEVSFSFPPGTRLNPGQHVVVANALNPAAFAARYPGVTVAGYFAGSLPNGGGRVTLLDPQGRIIQSVDYDDRNGWPREADGRGRSLEMIDPQGDPDDPANWTAAGPVYGTPGAAVAPPAEPAVRLNEVMADPVAFTNFYGAAADWLELFNAGPATVSLAGWSLSDGTDPRRFVFPAGTTIASGAYLVVWCDTATNQPGLHTGFGLSRDGESVALYDAATNRHDAVTIGAQIADLTVGRLDGAGLPWTLCQPTPGAANVPVELAASTNLCLNEWFANPVLGEDDWLEIHNRDATRPAALRDCAVTVGDNLARVGSLSFIPPGGFLRLWADKTPGADHLDLNLPAAGATVVLYDALAAEVDRVTYAAQTEGVSAGRLPDGDAALLDFPGTASPGASNWVSAYTGPVIHEVMARNRAAVTNAAGRVADWIELYNPDAAPAPLDGMSLGVGEDGSTRWTFPAGAQIAGHSRLVVWCDGGRPASTSAVAVLNLGAPLPGEGGDVSLFDASGRLVDSVAYGFQVDDRSIGVSGGAWSLLDAPTPGATNAPPAALGNLSLVRINEWMASPASGGDWFELYNMDALPADLSGAHLSDTPEMGSITNNPLAPLSFIGAGSWVLVTADGERDAGRDHVGFQLDGQGESIRLYSPGLQLVDAVEFGAQQAGVSEGLLPDGAAARVFFDRTPSPDSSNYVPLDDGPAINEVLSHTDPPLEDAIELFNPGASSAAVGGWYLSDDNRNPRKFRIPDGATIPAGGYTVFYEGQFNGGDGSLEPFNLNSFAGDSAILSETDAGGELTGRRAVVSFGAATNGMSIGRHPTSTGVDFVPLSARTFGRDDPSSVEDFRGGGGLPNAAPLVPPVVVSEIMFQSTNWFDEVAGVKEEYIELRNRTGAPAPLYDPAAPTNRWTLGGGIGFTIPPGTVVPSSGYLVVVNIDPVSNAAAVAAFRARHGVPAAVPIVGPFDGKLADEGERIEWLAPDTPEPDGPDAGYVPYVAMEAIAYANGAPWPAGAGGTGLSLQRFDPAFYGNECTNWRAWTPSPGRLNLPGPADDYDADGMTNGWETANGLDPENAADALLDSDGDGMTNRQEYLCGTNPRDAGSYLRVRSLAAEPAGRSVSFEAVAERDYSVMACDDLAIAGWWKWLDVPSAPTNRIVILLDTNAVPLRFYRLVTPAQP